VREVLRQFEKRDIVSHVRELTPALEEALDSLKDKYDFIKDRRGAGFMQALELDRPCAKVISRAQENGLLVISAGADTIRIVPPLIISKGDISDMRDRLDKALSES